MTQENAVTQDAPSASQSAEELDLSGLENLSPEEIEAALESEPSKDSGDQVPNVTPDLESALSRFGVKRDDLPEELRSNPAALKAAVDWAEKREKDLQRLTTKAADDLRAKYGGRDPDKVLAEADAFRTLSENERFQQWVTEVRAEMEGRSAPVANRETPPEHLKGEDLVNWYVDRRLNAVLNAKGYDSRLDLVSRYISKHEVDLMQAKYGDSFNELRPQVEKLMQELGVSADRAFKMAQSEKGVDIEAIRKEEREKILAKVQEHRNAQGTLTTSGRAGTTPNRASTDKSFDESFDDVIREVIAENPLPTE